MNIKCDMNVCMCEGRCECMNSKINVYMCMRACVSVWILYIWRRNEGKCEWKGKWMCVCVIMWECAKDNV